MFRNLNRERFLLRIVMAATTGLVALVLALRQPAVADIARDACQQAEQQGISVQDYAQSIINSARPVRRSKAAMDSVAFTTAGKISLETLCKLPLTYCERAEISILTSQVGRKRVIDRMIEFQAAYDTFGAADFCSTIQKELRGK